MNFLPQIDYIGSGSSQEATDSLASISGNGNHFDDAHSFQNTTVYDLGIPNHDELSFPSFDESGSSNLLRACLSHVGGENSSPHDFVNLNFMEENKQLAPLDHEDNFADFSYADEGNNMHEVLAQSSNMLPSLNFSGYCGADVLQPFNVSENSDSNACLMWNALDGSTNNVPTMLHFSGHTTQNKRTSQLHKQLCVGSDKKSSSVSNNEPPNTRAHWTPKEDECVFFTHMLSIFLRSYF